MLDDLALFIAIVEAGSLNQAAARLDLPTSTLTRRLQRLERELGCRLLHRSARRMTPTPEGWQYYERSRPLVHSLQQAVEQLDDSLRDVKGLLRVLAPINLANGVFADAWSGFLSRYPEVRLELQLSNQTQDLYASHADLAIRTGEQPDSQLQQRRLGEVEVRLVASPSYLRERPPPATPADLRRHDVVVAEPLALWSFRHRRSGERFELSPAGRLRVNDLGLAVDAARKAMGILMCPLNVCQHGLANGDLVEVMADWRLPSRAVYAVWPQQRYLPARVRALVEHLAAFATDQPLLRAADDPAGEGMTGML
jgi:LysR family transcriptional regulator AphB